MEEAIDSEVEYKLFRLMSEVIYFFENYHSVPTAAYERWREFNRNIDFYCPKYSLYEECPDKVMKIINWETPIKFACNELTDEMIADRTKYFDTLRKKFFYNKEPNYDISQLGFIMEVAETVLALFDYDFDYDLDWTFDLQY